MTDSNGISPESIDFEVQLIDAAAASAIRGEIVSMYRAAFSVAPWNTLETELHDFEDDILPRHLDRPGFAMSIARDSWGDLVGFCYGYIGEHGQYWTDYVAARIHPSLEKAWLGGHFEVAELAVDESERGKGIGRALLTVLLDSTSPDRIVLQTLESSSPARELYESLGFTAFGRFDDFVVLGLRRS